MNLKKLFIVSVIVFMSSFLLNSCSTLVRRWPGSSSELKNKTLPLQKKKNIFYDFLWTTPAVYSRKLSFVRRGKLKVARIKFANKDLELTLNRQGKMAISIGSDRKFQSSSTSKKNLYYDLDILKTKLVARQKLVHKTRYVSKQVAVQKSRMVSYQVSSYDYYSKSTRYTTRYRTEYYTDYEHRSVPENYTVWETIYESVIDIPEYKFFEFNIGGGQTVLVYKYNNQYFFQNPSYIAATDIKEGFFGNKKIKILFIDSNSNGVYFEPVDQVLINSWNPYERNSRYQEVSNYLDNYWYLLNLLKTDKFVSFSPDSQFSKLLVKNANAKYIGVKERGIIRISNVPKKKSHITINGYRYRQNSEGIFEAEVEYGLFNLLIEYKGHLDFRTTFTINDKNNYFNLDYKTTPESGVLNITNIPVTIRNWNLIIKDKNGKSSIYHNKKHVNLKYGTYQITLSSGGLNLKKQIIVKTGLENNINYNAELKKIAVSN